MHSAQRFPNTIARYRRSQRLTRTALATTVQCSHQYLARVEAGAALPNAILLHDLARALNVLVDALFDREWSWARRVKIHAASTHRHQP